MYSKTTTQSKEVTMIKNVIIILLIAVHFATSHKSILDHVVRKPHIQKMHVYSMKDVSYRPPRRITENRGKFRISFVTGSAKIATCRSCYKTGEDQGWLSY